jgi:RimJ/RimL family protein N-acetyltransferase
MVGATFHLDGYTVCRLTPEDAPDLQDLFERCSDFHELSEGVPTGPTAGADELLAKPEGKQLSDKHSFGIRARTGELIGYIELMRDYPAERQWWIGLLMLDPHSRAQGLGTRIHRAAMDFVGANGGTLMQIAVLEQNPAAQRFWQRQGYEEIRRVPYVADTGKQSRLIVMRRELSAAP